jgi:hypothetical protein
MEIQSVPSRQDYQEFLHTLGGLWPKREQPVGGGINSASNDLWRTQYLEEGSESAYMMLNPHAKDLSSATDEEFEHVANQVGPDVYRLRAVPPALLQPHTEILPTGGSCAIETFGVRVTKELQRRTDNGELPQQCLADAASRLLEAAPTASHISGAILSGAKHAVHYVESGLWTETADKLGVPDPEAAVQQAYDRINEAISRRAKLINPDSEMHFINFDDLHLPDAVQEWFDDIGLEYDPRFGIPQVLYTYKGPKMLPTVREILNSRNDGSHPPDDRTTHVARLKQLDHNSWDSMAIPAGVVSGQRELTPEERDRLQQSSTYAAGIRMAQWMFEHESENPSIVGGFFDLPHGDDILHMTPNLRPDQKFSGKLTGEQVVQVVEDILTDPLRLHRGTYEDHFALLESYLDPSVGKTKMTLINEKKAHVETLKPPSNQVREVDARLRSLGSQLTSCNEKLTESQALLEFVNVVSDDTNESWWATELNDSGKLKPGADALYRRASAVYRSIASRKNNDEPLSQMDADDLQQAQHIMEAIQAAREGSVTSMKPASSLLEKFSSSEEQIYREKTARIAELAVEEKTLQDQRPALMAQVEPIRARMSEIDRQIRRLPRVFPLQENPFITHALNFTWDPDCRRFLKDAVDITEEVKDPSEREALVRSSMTRIYPKIRAYYDYIYANTDQYPQERFQSVY